MHHALQVQEVLLDIFGSCYGCYGPDYPTLASLARTCRTFKEPALDVLWEELSSLSPLARCLPEASERQSEFEYSFRRPLTEIEWCTLRNYTHRIRQIRLVGLDEKSLIFLSNHPTAELLFPNVCSISFWSDPRHPPLNTFYFPFPSLRFIHGELTNPPHWFQEPLESLSKFSPNITSLKLFQVGTCDATFSKSVSRCICRWKNIRCFSCFEVALDADALEHLSRIPSLTEVCCMLSAPSPAFDSPLIFSNLAHVVLHSQSLQTISQLLFQAKLPTLVYFSAAVENSASKAGLSTFLNNFRTSTNSHIIHDFALDVSDRADHLLTLQDLELCMAFSNLRSIRLIIGWNVGLEDRDVLMLASAWPHLTHFWINLEFGWNGAGGITPHGLLALLQTCRSLSSVTLAMDTRGYVEVPQRGLLASLMYPRSISLDLLDTKIEEESVPALAKFFSRTQKFAFCFLTWFGGKLLRPPEWEMYDALWNDVISQALRSPRTRRKQQRRAGNKRGVCT